MAKNVKEFVISTANVAFYQNDALAFTGTTCLNTSMTVSMEDLEIKGGQGDKLLYKAKYGRKLAASIEMAEWNLNYIAANVGSAVATAAKDVYVVAECVTLTSGAGTLAKQPVTGTKISVEHPDGTISEVTADASKNFTSGTASENVRCTYKYNTTVKRITIDADSTPLVGTLILSAEKYDNANGKTGDIQIEIPSFQVSGNFDISLESTGNVTTKIDGDALAVDGVSCSDGAVYAYISEINSGTTTASYNYIVATPSVISLANNATQQLSVIGVRGGLYANVDLTADCVYTDISGDTTAITVSAGGLITADAVNDGVAYITVSYDEGAYTDVVEVTVA